MRELERSVQLSGAYCSAEVNRSQVQLSWQRRPTAVWPARHLHERNLPPCTTYWKYGPVTPGGGR